MNALSVHLHEPPRWLDVASVQVKAVRMRIKTLTYLVVGMYGLLLCAAIGIAMRARELNARHAAYQMANFTFTPRAVAPLLILAIIMPLIIWEGEGPRRRSYHLMMPMRQHTHSLTRVFAGWVWLMMATAAYLMTLVVAVAVMEAITGATQPYARNFVAWEWLVPFTSVTVAYVLASVATLATEQPLLWILGVVAIVGGCIALLHILGYESSATTMLKIYSGKFGARASLLGDIEWRAANGTLYPNLLRWIGATGIWIAAAVALLNWQAARRTEAAS